MTFAPGDRAPLCAIGVAIATALDQWCPPPPGTEVRRKPEHDGRHRSTKYHRYRRSLRRVLRLRRRAPACGLSSVLQAFHAAERTHGWVGLEPHLLLERHREGNFWSASLHSGSPTFSMFAYIVSAITLLKCIGHAEPRGFATRLPCRSSSRRPSRSSRRSRTDA